MHFLVTGHTGFKGSWLTLLLRARGHEVSGLSLDPVDGGLFRAADVAPELRDDLRGDVRDREAVVAAIQTTQPDVVIHMAAQPLVRESLRDPRTTVETNVIGTLNVLEAVRDAASVQAQVIVTTDKVYRNTGQVAGYREQDPLGGDDPYSASKAMVELLTHAWTKSFAGPPTATARAGNVIGGGDVSRDRLLPDLLTAFALGQAARIRYPEAIRPWQHVLDATNGYLALVEALVARETRRQTWNFGPPSTAWLTVRQVADQAAAQWGDGALWTPDASSQPHESQTLTLDPTLATKTLGWAQRLAIEEAISWTVQWRRRVQRGEDAASVTREHVSAFEALERRTERPDRPPSNG